MRVAALRFMGLRAIDKDNQCVQNPIGPAFAEARFNIRANPSPNHAPFFMPAPPAPTPLPTGSTMPLFSAREFRDALGMFATGITIVTARNTAGEPIGLTASSFNSVSVAPPLVLWSLAHRSSAIQVFSTCTHYAIHVLGADQQALAERFATRDIDRWAGIPYTPGASGTPLLQGVLATFECFNRSRYDEGDHLILVGEVEHCTHRTGIAPLLYHGGRFHTPHLPPKS